MTAIINLYGGPELPANEAASRVLARMVLNSLKGERGDA